MNFEVQYGTNGRPQRVYLYPYPVLRTGKIRYFSVPTDWEMFTSAGNRSLTKKAEGFIKRLAEGKPRRAFEMFFRGYAKMGDSASYGEAMDTAVRECVYCFAKEFATILDWGEMEMEKLWEEYVR